MISLTRDPTKYIGLKPVLVLHSPFLFPPFLGGKRKRVKNISYRTKQYQIEIHRLNFVFYLLFRRKHKQSFN